MWIWKPFLFFEKDLSLGIDFGVSLAPAEALPSDVSVNLIKTSGAKKNQKKKGIDSSLLFSLDSCSLHKSDGLFSIYKSFFSFLFFQKRIEIKTYVV